MTKPDSKEPIQMCDFLSCKKWEIVLPILPFSSGKTVSASRMILVLVSITFIPPPQVATNIRLSSIKSKSLILYSSGAGEVFPS